MVDLKGSHFLCCRLNDLLQYVEAAQLHQLHFFHTAHKFALRESRINVQKNAQHLCPCHKERSVSALASDSLRYSELAD